MQTKLLMGSDEFPTTRNMLNVVSTSSSTSTISSDYNNENQIVVVDNNNDDNDDDGGENFSQQPINNILFPFGNRNYRTMNGNSSSSNNNNSNNGNNNNNSNANSNHHDQSSNNKNSRKYRPNYFSFIKKSAITKGTFEINGRHNECISCKNNVFFVKNLKFPDCVIRNLCQTYKYQGELWFQSHDNSNEGDQCYESIYEKIHVELNDFYSFIKPLKEDEILRKATYFCISDSIKKLKFVRQVKYYGSYSSKTYLPVSDIDLVVYCNTVTDQLNILLAIAETLSYDGIIESKFNIIPTSRIPLLKFNDALTGFPINITINTPYVMERAQYLKENIKYNSHQMKILFFLKYYLLSKGSNQVYYGGIGSYALALMVIRFFQEESVKELIRKEDTYQNSILGYLLMGFLERFGDVNFFKNHVISVQDDGEYIECDFTINRYPNNPEKKSSILRIKDHIEPWNDVSYGSFNSAEILKDFQFLHTKFMKADKSKSNSLLGQVLYVVDSFIEYRNLLLFLFRKWFDDYDVKEYIAGRYPSIQKYQEFIEKRRIFRKNHLEFSQTYMEDKSIEFKILEFEPFHSNRSFQTAAYFNTNQEYENRFNNGFHNNNNKNQFRLSENRNVNHNNYHNNHHHNNKNHVNQNRLLPPIPFDRPYHKTRFNKDDNGEQHSNGHNHFNNGSNNNRTTNKRSKTKRFNNLIKNSPENNKNKNNSNQTRLGQFSNADSISSNINGL